MAKSKKVRANKKLSVCRSFRPSDYPKALVYGDLVLRGRRIAVEAPCGTIPARAGPGRADGAFPIVR